MSNINDKTVGRGTSEPIRSGRADKTLLARQVRRTEKFFKTCQCPIEMVEDMACGFRKDKDGEIYVCSAYSESWYNIKECEFSHKAAEARLKELQGE